WPYPNRYAQSRHDLQSAPEVVRPAKTRIEQQRAAPSSFVGRNHFFVPVKYGFKQEIETRLCQPYKTLAQVICKRARPRSGVVASMGNDSRACVPVCDELLGHYEAHRKLRLDPCAPRATSTAKVTRGQKHAQPWSKCHLGLTASQYLVSVIEKEIADSSAGLGVLPGMQQSKCVTELVSRTCVDRPLLRKGVDPILAVQESLKGLNVLHYTKLLVVRFFDQEAVVLDWRSVL